MGVVGIVKTGDEWEFRCLASQKHIPQSMGWQWDRARRGWFTRMPGKVAETAQAAAQSGVKVHSASLPVLPAPDWKGHLSLAKTGPDFPVPPDRDYFPFQKGGIAYALARKNTLIADEPGLGKTIQAIGVMNVTEPQSVLILCPASIKHQWACEIDEWLNFYRSVGVVEGGRWPKSQVVIANYDVLTRRKKELREREWDLVVADEAHYLKNPAAKRAIAVLGGKGERPVSCKKFIGLTGTPVDNHPVDLFGILHYMLPSYFPSWWQYTLLYCGGEFKGFDYNAKGASNMKVLGQILRENVMVRRTKSQVLSQLPPKRREFIPLDATGKARDAVRIEMDAYQSALSEMRFSETSRDATAFNEARLTALNQISKARLATAIAKVKPASEVIEEWIDSEKVVIVCYHRAVIAGLEQAFQNRCVSLHGGIPVKARPQVLQDFARDSRKRVLIMQIGVGGTGVDGLQKVCSHGAVMEFDWRPGVMLQAEDRLWRIGQSRGVLWSYFYLPDSVDNKMLDANREKAWVASSILDDCSEEESNFELFEQ